MKILVTGSSGHLGEALVRTLRGKNRDVIGVDIIPSEFTDEVGSIVDRQFVKQCMESVNAVIHAATLHKPHVITHMTWIRFSFHTPSLPKVLVNAPKCEQVLPSNMSSCPQS